ncbi:kinase-like domain-containing protein, partial [Leptodontidium sp. 2 PMI_412]
YEHGGFYAVVLGETFSSRRYTVVHKLSHGGFATVWLVWDHTNREYVALKILRADQSESCEELEILQYLARLGVNLEENFICPLLDSFSFDGPNGHHLCLVFPLAGQSVDTRLFSSRPETKEERIEMARQYGRQLAHAVAFLHSVGIVHGDLTQRNILTQTSGLQIDSLDELYKRLGESSRVLADHWGPGCRFKYLVYPADLSGLPSSNKLLLTDFGQAFSIGHPPAWGLGTPTKFATPEGIYLDAASPGSDVWAIGVLLFEWWCGQPLFRGDYRDEVSWYWTAFLGKLPEAIWSQYTDRYKSFDDD